MLLWYDFMDKEINMQYGLTTSVKDKLKLATLPAGTEENPMFCWEVNLKKVYNRNVLMIVHADTRYCLVFVGMTTGTWKNLQTFIDDAIFRAFIDNGFTEQDACRYFRMTSPPVFTKTHGKVAIGGMNHIASYLPWIIEEWDSELYQRNLSKNINGELCHIAAHPEEDYCIPCELFVREMRKLLSE